MQVGTLCHIYLLSFEVKGSFQMDMYLWCIFWTCTYGGSFEINWPCKNMLELHSQSPSLISKDSSYQVKTLLNFVSPTPMAPGRWPSLHGKVRLQAHNFPPASPCSLNDTDSQAQLVRAGGCWFCTAAAAGGGAGQWQAGRPRLGAVQQAGSRRRQCTLAARSTLLLSTPTLRPRHEGTKAATAGKLR